jgi:hypothetical protein
VLYAFLNFGCELLYKLASDHLDKLARFVMKMAVRVAGLNPIKIVSNGADVLRDRPFVIVQNHNETFRVIANVI